METALIARVLANRRMLLGRDRWSRRRLEVHQAAALRDLRDFATSNSAFYPADLLRDVRFAGAAPLPVVVQLVRSIHRGLSGKAPLVRVGP